MRHRRDLFALIIVALNVLAPEPLTAQTSRRAEQPRGAAPQPKMLIPTQRGYGITRFRGPVEAELRFVLRELEESKTDEDRAASIEDLARLDMAPALQAIEQAAGDAGNSEALRLFAAQYVTPRFLEGLVRSEHTPDSIRSLALSRAIGALGSPETDRDAAALLQALVTAQECKPAIRSAASSAIPTAIRAAAANLDHLVTLDVTAVSEPAKREHARLRALHPQFPVADIACIEQWKTARIKDLEEKVKAYPGFKKLGTESIRHLRPMPIAKASLELLTEFYDASERSRDAAGLAASASNMAEAAKSLPSIAWTEEVHDNVRGYDKITSSSDHEFDLSVFVPLLMQGLAADASLRAIRTGAVAAGDSAYLSRLTPETLDSIKLAYLERFSRDPKVRALAARARHAQPPAAATPSSHPTPRASAPKPQNEGEAPAPKTTDPAAGKPPGNPADPAPAPPDSPTAKLLVDHARELLNNNQLDEAKRILKDVISKYPGTASAQYAAELLTK